MADTFIISAYAIYKATHFTGFDSNNQIGIPVAQLNAYVPRNVWLKRYLVPGQNQIQELLTFEVNSADLLDTNLLQGIYIEVDGQGVMIDCISTADFIAVANGSQATITRRYGSGIPAFVTPTPTIYYIHRVDNASGSAHDDVATDYLGQYIGNVTFSSQFSGTSVYKISSYTVPVAIGSDVVNTTP